VADKWHYDAGMQHDGSRHLGTILGYSFSPVKFHLSLLGSLASLMTWRHLATTVGTSRKTAPGGCTISLMAAVQPGPWLRALMNNNVSCIYEGDSNENLKSAIKIQNTARLSCKLTIMILMV
jgi:hypothetical protein